MLAAAWGHVPDASAETIVVVRHGDRDRSKPDQPLLPAGENRARAVGGLLHDERLDHVFFTRDETEKPKDWLRMCQTAQGICAGLAGSGGGSEGVGGARETEPSARLKPEPMPRFGDEGAPLAQWLLGEDGKSHPHVGADDHLDVVVLHHEAIPGLVDQLVSPDDPRQGPHVKVGREDYDNVFILSREKGEKKFSLVRLSLTPPPAAAPAATQPAPGCEAGLAPGEGGEAGRGGEGKAGGDEARCEKKDAAK